MVDYSAPQLRDMSEPFVSSVRAALSGRTRELERLAVELYDEAYRRATSRTGSPTAGRWLLSRTAVSEITERLWAEYEDFCKRDLSERAIVYLFVDGIAERLGRASGGRRLLPPWGIGEGGRKSLLGLMTGSKEDVETVRAFSQDLRARGVGDPLLVVSDRDRGMLSAIGAPALRGAPDAQSPGQGPDRPMAGVKGAGCRLLSGALARDRAPTGYRRSHRLRRFFCRARSPVSKMLSRPASQKVVRAALAR